MTNLSQSDFLDNLKWQNRVILLFAPNTEDSNIDRQIEILKNNKDGLEERDLKVFIVESDNIRMMTSRASQNADADELREELKINEASFTFVLIGKDGTVKLKETTPVSKDKLFDLIDSMPMRRREMKDQ